MTMNWGYTVLSRTPVQRGLIVLEPVAKNVVSGNIPVGLRMGSWIMDVVDMRPEHMGKNGFTTNQPP